MFDLPDVRTIYSRLKASAKKRNIPFTLELTDLWEMSIPRNCPILGIPLKHNKGKADDNSISYDRIDNSKGYEKGNVIIISNKANTLKRNATKEELKQLAEFYNKDDVNYF